MKNWLKIRNFKLTVRLNSSKSVFNLFNPSSTSLPAFGRTMERLTSKKNSLFIILIILSFVFSSCSSISQYDASYRMTDKLSETSSSELKFNIPVGFFVPRDTNLNEFEFWLINENLNASLSLVKINIDSKAIRDIYPNRLPTLLKYSKTMRRAQFGKSYHSIGKDEIFTVGNLRCASAKIIGENKNPIRIIIFEYRKRYYELTASTYNAKISDLEIDNLYSAQNSILASIK